MTAGEYLRYTKTGKLPERMTRRSIEHSVDVWSITVDTDIPNELSPNWSPRHIRDAWAIKKRHGDNVAAAFVNATKYNFMARVNEPVVITWTVYLGKGRRLQDRNNLLGGGLKRLQDELVKAGVISDDIPSVVLDPKLEQILFKEHGGAPRVVIKVESHGQAV